MDVGSHIAFLYGKAVASIGAAKVLLNEYPDFAVARAYYAMFYMAEAALLTKGMNFKSHHGVISAFNKEFVREGAFPGQYSKVLRKAYDFRAQGDYSLVPVEREKAEALLNSAVEFIETVKAFLVSNGFSESVSDL